MDVALHPNFGDNRLVYLTYSKPGAQDATVAGAQGRLDAAALADVHEIFVADAWSPWDWQFGWRIILRLRCTDCGRSAQRLTLSTRHESIPSPSKLSG